MKIRTTRTNESMNVNLGSNLSKLLRKVYTRIAIKSRFTLNDEAAREYPNLDIMEFVNTSNWTQKDNAVDCIEARSRCVFIPTPSQKLRDVSRYLLLDETAAEELGVTPEDMENYQKKALVPTYNKFHKISTEYYRGP